MKVLVLRSTSPHVNLASEYRLFIKKDLYGNEDLFIIWKNKNTVVIGRNQNLNAEVNMIYANEIHANISRRFSGGGAVYQDDGNICFTFIKRDAKKFFNFKDCLIDIVDFFKSQNLNATFSGRNDILINDKKVSGNAVYFNKDDYLIHGTILFDVNIETMLKILTVDKTKLTSKGIESVKSRVLNIKDVVADTRNQFELKLINYFENKYNNKADYLDLSDEQYTKEFLDETFGNPSWIYGRDFDFNYENKITLKSGILTVRLKTDKGIISDISFYTDSLFANNLNKLAELLKNTNYQINTVKNKLANYNLDSFCLDLDIDLLINLVFPS